MVRIDTPVQSDDDFDLVYSADSVSEMSDSEAPRKQPQPDLAATSSHTVVVTGAAPPALVRPGSERLTGPHEVPVMPFSAEHDGELANLSQEFSEHSIRNESAGAPSSSLSRGSGTTKSRINDGLQYTKSMYNKFWHKDALIAVMGYVSKYQSNFTGTFELMRRQNDWIWKNYIHFQGHWTGRSPHRTRPHFLYDSFLLLSVYNANN